MDVVDIYRKQWTCLVAEETNKPHVGCTASRPHESAGCCFMYVAPRLTRDQYRRLLQSAPKGKHFKTE